MIDWQKAPEWANYTAMDEDGKWWFYRLKPETQGGEWVANTNESLHATMFEAPRFDGDMKDSLQERPSRDVVKKSDRARKILADISVENSLRDQFAMAALTGLISHHGNDGSMSGATYAYDFADAMMEARK